PGWHPRQARPPPAGRRAPEDPQRRHPAPIAAPNVPNAGAGSPRWDRQVPASVPVSVPRFVPSCFCARGVMLMTMKSIAFEPEIRKLDVVPGPDSQDWFGRYRAYTRVTFRTSSDG